MEHSRCFFPREWNKQIHAYSSLYAYATTTLSHYCHLLILLFEPCLPNIRSETKPNVRTESTEAERRTKPKTSAALPTRICAFSHCTTGSRCDIANNGEYKPTLGPFPFARKKTPRVFHSPSHFVIFPPYAIFVPYLLNTISIIHFKPLNFY